MEATVGTASWALLREACQRAIGPTSWRRAIVCVCVCVHVCANIRWCQLHHGRLYYYGCREEQEQGSAALGALVLRGASVRRPTALGSKGKWKHTCFRLDVDAQAQAKVVTAVAVVAAGSAEDDGDREEGEEEGEEDEEGVPGGGGGGVRGRLGKTKWLFATESIGEMAEWMEALAWWSVYEDEEGGDGPAQRTLSAEDRVRLRAEALAAAEAQLREEAQRAQAASAAAAAMAQAEAEAAAEVAAAAACATNEGDSSDADGGDEAAAARLARVSVADQAADSADGAATHAGGAPATAAVDIVDSALNSYDAVDILNSAGTAGARSSASSASSEAAAARAELDSWTILALQHQLQAMGHGSATGGAEHPELAEAYWQMLGSRGAQLDVGVRRFLVTGSEGGASARGSMDRPPSSPTTPSAHELEAQMALWISCVTGMRLDGALQPLLRSGEVLCDFVNALRPGAVAKVARYAEIVSLHVSSANARMRENISQYIDACAALGLPQRDLFSAADLFESKNFRAVLQHLEGLARFVQHDLPSFRGPCIGRRARKKLPGPSTGVCPGVLSAIGPRVVLSGGGGGFSPGITGRT